MKISQPTTSQIGTDGTVLVEDVNGKTVQDIIVNFTKKNVRIIVDAIKLITKAVDTLSNGATVKVTEITEDTFTAASLSTALTGTNNDLVFTAATAGTDGNSITVAYIDPSANDAELSVEVTGTDIVVNLATGVAGAITSTAAQVKAAIEAEAAAAALVTVAHKSANDGTGVVTALAETALAGGLNWTVGNALVTTTDLADSDAVGKVQSLTVASDQVVEGGRALLIQVTTGSTANTDTKDILINYHVA